MKVADAVADLLDLLTWPKSPMPPPAGTSWLDWGPAVGRQVVPTSGPGQRPLSGAGVDVCAGPRGQERTHAWPRKEGTGLRSR